MHVFRAVLLLCGAAALGHGGLAQLHGLLRVQAPGVHEQREVLQHRRRLAGLGGQRLEAADGVLRAQRGQRRQFSPGVVVRSALGRGGSVPGGGGVGGIVGESLWSSL